MFTGGVFPDASWPYSDHKTKAVFNGCDLGKGYSAKGLEDKMFG